MYRSVMTTSPLSNAALSRRPNGGTGQRRRGRPGRCRLHGVALADAGWPVYGDEQALRRAHRCLPGHHARLQTKRARTQPNWPGGRTAGPSPARHSRPGAGEGPMANHGQDPARSQAIRAGDSADRVATAAPAAACRAHHLARSQAVSVSARRGRRWRYGPRIRHRPSALARPLPGSRRPDASFTISLEMPWMRRAIGVIGCAGWNSQATGSPMTPRSIGTTASSTRSGGWWPLPSTSTTRNTLRSLQAVMGSPQPISARPWRRDRCG